ncbi:helix-turn-helix transcriptional regulator [Paenarthrobacter nitroguajacolicus]|uniref:helix-turn-helix transcriptional regulator n=1 Tax=Paenarthrobacter nitroguajacolicus TaxID=211146 RepID=UPI000A537799|nr:response regulator transcription factor family protein [Paenarthrobacter nitroguajacolicus]
MTSVPTVRALPALSSAAQIWQLLDSISALAEAPLTHIAEQLREATRPYVQNSALIIFTEDCTGRPQKKAGDESIISRVSIAELDRLSGVWSGLKPRMGEAVIGGASRSILAFKYSPSNAMLVITDPSVGQTEAEHSGNLAITAYLWNLAAGRIREKVADAPPSYLLESRAASAERARVTAELVDQYSTSLETLLAALRSPSLDDRAARSSVTDMTAKMLVGLRTLSDRTTDLIEESVVNAFERLRDDLRPLTRLSGIDVQFVEPPSNGRALPGEVAHAARAIVRGLVLAMMEQPDVKRVRTQWDCDGENLLINVRDDGRGALAPDAPSIGRVDRRVQALSGRMELDVMPGWGADVSVTLPLATPTSPAVDFAEWNIVARELEVLQLLASGQRNRSIAAAMGISENTVKFHVRNLFKKMGVRSRIEAIALAHSRGLR